MNKNFSRTLLVLLVSTGLSLLFSCKRINPDKPPLAGESHQLPKASSEVNLSLSIPLAKLEKELNQNLQGRLFSERGLEIASGLFSDVDVDKTGQIVLRAIEGGRLRLSMPVHLDGKVKLEKKIFGQPVSASLPFEENLTPQVSFKPGIDKNWNVTIMDLELESWGKPLTYNLLGYEVNLEPLIKKQLKTLIEQELVSQGLNRLSLKKLAEQTWQAYGQPIHLKNDQMDLFMVTIPEKMRIQEEFTMDQHLVLNIGMEGEVLSQVGSPPAMGKNGLPDVSPNSSTSSQMEITLPLALSYKTISNYLNQEMVGKSFRVDSKTQLIPASFSTQPYGSKALVSMEFNAIRENKRDIEGVLHLVGKPVFDPEREAIVFEEVEFEINTANFLTNSANWLKRRKILNAIEKQAVFPIGEYMAEAKKELEQIGTWQTAFANIGLQNPILSVAGIYPTEEDIRMYVKSSGDIQVQLKP
ncbi:DUF4403 family protein [Pleomorphovibrio marinus]|uniref:DUF4403 family protein n=1 Tax=Pleomorphovibrio marinus TaxID=2164132 RepID=UPI001300AE3A|nr:DUF4403 family protein [Pleomorphovibrio marinus]